MLPGIVMGWNRLAQSTGCCCVVSDILHSIWTTGEKLWRSRWGKISLILSVALAKDKPVPEVTQSQWGDVWMSYPNVPHFKTHLFHCSAAVIECWLCDCPNFVAVPVRYDEHFCCIWQSCQPSISLCQLSAMSTGPTHLFLVFVR